MSVIDKLMVEFDAAVVADPVKQPHVREFFKATLEYEFEAPRIAAKLARSALSDLLATGDPLVYTAALRALDEALGTKGR